MPHVIVKLWPGRTEEQKKRLADEIVKDGIQPVRVGQVAVQE
ncbi:MAG: tautomerase family protein [Anaerolineae bacterium]|jgi:4-oxalocrotonate tautomerase